MRAYVRATLGIGALCFLFFLIGCQQQPPWYLNARKAGETVELCLSHESACPQQNGISLDSISVYRYDSLKDNEPVWDALPQSEGSDERIDGVFT